MKFSKWLAIYTIIILASSLGVGAIYHFSVKGEVDVVASTLSVSPKSFTVSISEGSEFVKKITVKNTGGEKEIYFENVVEGPNPDSISISYYDWERNIISSSNKLNVPAGSSTDPSVVPVYIHIKVGSGAVGSYTIYVMAKSTE